MVRRFPALFLAAAFILALGVALPAAAAPIRLARHPDYHAGKVTFSYLGDIWIANEDGSNVQRLTDNTAREIYPRFSPDGKWIAFSSNRYGNNDVFVIPATGGTARAFPLGDLEIHGEPAWMPDGQAILVSAGAPPDAAHAPTAITTRGPGIASIVRRTAASRLRVTGPVTTTPSASPPPAGRRDG